MRSLRLFVYLFVGLLLGVNSVLAFAETIAATSDAPIAVIPDYWAGGGWCSANTPGCGLKPTQAEACQSGTLAGKDSSPYQHPTLGLICANAARTASMASLYVGSGSCPVGSTRSGSNCVFPLTCPAGQGWTLSGSSCSRPDCVAPQIRQADGTCKAADCPTGVFSNGLYKGQPASTACAPNGCTLIFSGAYPTNKDAEGNLYAKGGYDYAPGGTQGQCTPGGVVSPSPAGPPKTTPPCAPGEGVVTSTSGTVACVPSGTPGATPPKVTTESQTKVNPDGSGETTETKTTCAADGTCTETKKKTATPKPDGAPGDSGTPGDSVETKEKQNDDFCGKDPTNPACKNICDEHPDRLECKDLGEPPVEGELNKTVKGVSSISTVSFASSASCPADISLPRGSKLSFSYSCQLATGLRPILLALAWLSAGLIVMGAFRA